MSQKLVIKKWVAGQVAKLGEIDFPDTGPAKLTVWAKDAAAEELRTAWDTVQAMPVIRMKWSESDPGDKSGDSQLLKGRDVAKGHPDYPRAVGDILSRRYGLFASPAELG